MKWNGHIKSGLCVWIALAVVMGTAQAAMAQGGDEVYRIVIAKDVGDKEGRDNRLMLETLGYIPVHMTGDFTAGRGTVTLGNFPTQKEAQKMKEQLVRDGFSPLDIIKEKRAATGTGSYTVLAGGFEQQATANSSKDRLVKAGMLDVQVRKDEKTNRFLVTVGSFTSPDQANTVVASLKDTHGFTAAAIVDATDLKAVVVNDIASAASPKLSAADIEKATGKKLTDAEISEIAALVEKRVSLESQRSSTTSGTVSEEIVKLNQRLAELDKKVGGVVESVTKLQEERFAEANKRKKVSELLRDSINLSKGGRNEEALVKIREILAMDPENQIAMQRERVLQGMIDGTGPEGMEGDLERRYEGLKAQALASEEANTIPELTVAKGNWAQIRVMHSRYEAEADAKMAAIGQKIAQLQAEQASAVGGQAAGGNLIYGLIGAVVLLVVIVVFVLYRQNKQKQDILEKLQEATSLRPMRGLPGGGRRQGDYGLMAPPGMSGPGGQLPSPDAGFQGFDPLGGSPHPQPGFGGAPQPGFGAPMGAPVAQAGADDLFSSEPEPSKPAAAVMAAPPPPPKAAPKPAPAATSSLDDILGGLSSPSTPAPAPAASSSLDDILSGIGSAPKAVAPAPSPEPEPSAVSPLDDIFNPKPVAPPKKAPIEETSSVSLDDILGIGSSSAPPAPQAPAPSAPASAAPSLDDILGLGSAPKPAAAPASNLSLDSILGGASDLPQMKSPAPADSIPSFGGDETIIDPHAAQFAGSGSPIPGLGGVSSPASDETIGGLTPMPSGLNGEAFVMNFEGDSVGQKPASWTGEFPYATLNVLNDTPPEGSRNYLAYEKKEGVGKVYYSTKFPNTSGVLSVEFDLRCNDKNKFLLGFYIEKDEDFQQSIHTKILRSESQTAPSIHIHGQPAPYLLGTWARIKYVIDLNEGKVDGFVDGRQVAKAITLPQVPKYLNTLAIRDNINTTGSLFIDNITVKKIS